MNKKYIITLVLCVVALLGYVFLPFISVMGYEVSLMEIFEMATEMGGGSSDGEGGAVLIYLLMTAIGGIAGIVFSVMRKKTLVMVTSIVAAAGILLFLFELNDAMGGLVSIFDYLGSAPWIGILGFAGSAVVAGALKEDF